MLILILIFAFFTLGVGALGQERKETDKRAQEMKRERVHRSIAASQTPTVPTERTDGRDTNLLLLNELHIILFIYKSLLHRYGGLEDMDSEFSVSRACTSISCLVSPWRILKAYNVQP